MSGAPRSRVNQILIESLAPECLPALDLEPSEWECLWVSARDHCLAPYLHKRWTESGLIARLPSGAAERFTNARSKNAERNRQLVFALDELRTALQEKGIPILISKGLPLAQLYYGDLGLRVLYDLDLLINIQDRDGTFDVLRDIGYAPFFPNHRSNRHQTLFWRPREYVWQADGVFNPDQPCFVEVHTRPWEPHWHGFRVECNLDLWKGHRIQQVAGMPLRVPLEEKLLSHLAVHYAFNVLESNARLMHLLDIALLLRLRGTTLDWDMILNDIGASRVAPFCFLTLELAGRAGRCELPGRVRSALRQATPPGIVGWLGLRGVDDVASMNLHHRERSLIYFLHWNMAAEWPEKASVLLYSLRAPWLEEAGVGRWKSLIRRMGRRLHHLARGFHSDGVR